MSKKNSFYFSRLLTFIIYGVFAWYAFNNLESFKILLEVSVYPLIAIYILKILITYNSGQFIRVVLRAFNKDISRSESYYLSLISSLGNFFGPFLSGAGVRAVYLKKRHGLSYAKFASTLSGYYFITFFVFSIIGLLSLIVIQVTTGEYMLLMYLVLGGWLVSTLLLAEVRGFTKLIDVTSKHFSFLSRIIKKIHSIQTGWRTIRENRLLTLKLVGLTCIGFLISYGVISFQFKAINLSPSLASVALYVVITNLSLLVSITPGSVGIREAMFIFSSSLLGLNVDQILQLAVVSRGMIFVFMVSSFLILKILQYFKVVDSFDVSGDLEPVASD